VGLGLAALGVSVAIRVRVAGQAGSQSPTAGLIFAILLVIVVAAFGMPAIRLDRRQLAWGVAGAVTLCAPAAVAAATDDRVALPLNGFLLWSFVVMAVAIAEELLLRGALFEAVQRWHGETAAIVLTTVDFAALHVPIYGAHVLPIDLAAGLVLGMVRSASGSVTAPAITHTVTDLATWWLR